MHHFLVCGIFQAVATSRMEEMMGDAVTGICMQSYYGQLADDDSTVY